MTPSASDQAPGATQLLAVACPTCFAAIAVGADLFGGPADCPLCGGGFNVPLKAAPPPPAAAPGSQPPAQAGPAAAGRPATPSQGAAAAGSGSATTADTAAPLTATAAAGTPATSPPLTSAPARAVPLDSPIAGGTTATTVAGGHDDPLAAAASPAPSSELAFHEPVMTVGSGDNVIELRRLTPEEKAQRRARRNIVMLLLGVSILMTIVLSLGRSRR